MNPHRRDFLLQTPAMALAANAPTPSTIAIDPTPRFEISPRLYMQFMEPLGVTDSSVEAAWDYHADDWRKDVVEATRDLAPGALRYGGNFSRYYKWREGVGPVKSRPPMMNYDWGGKETNRVGVHEFSDFARRVGAEAFYCVNFLSDGHKTFWNTRHEGNRGGDAREAADWVSYCNDPDDRLRRSHGHAAPYGLKLWQVGNETSYSKEAFSRDECIAHTITFATEMRRRDPSIEIIGWGDWRRGESEELWAGAMLERAGEHLNYIALHLMGQRPTRPDTVLRGLRYQSAPRQAWQELLELSDNVEKRVRSLREAVESRRSKVNLAITEGHLSLSPHNSNPILLEWLSSVYHARSMNIYQRHGDRVKIATCADFCGNRWTVNALMIQVPRGVSYLSPAGSVMRLFRRHNGTHGVAVTAAPTGLDIAASRAGNKLFLHVVNLDYARAVEADFRVLQQAVAGGRVFEIAPENPREYVNQDQPDVFRPREKPLPASGKWRFPARSVSAVELDLA